MLCRVLVTHLHLSPVITSAHLPSNYVFILVWSWLFLHCPILSFTDVFSLIMYFRSYVNFIRFISTVCLKNIFKSYCSEFLLKKKILTVGLTNWQCYSVSKGEASTGRSLGLYIYVNSKTGSTSESYHDFFLCWTSSSINLDSYICVK